MILQQALQDEADMFHMVGVTLGENEDVVHIDKNKMVNKVSQQIITKHWKIEYLVMPFGLIR